MKERSEENILFRHAAFDDNTDSDRELTVRAHKHGVSITIGLRYQTASGELQMFLPEARLRALIYALERVSSPANPAG